MLTIYSIEPTCTVPNPNSRPPRLKNVETAHFEFIWDFILFIYKENSNTHNILE